MNTAMRADRDRRTGRADGAQRPHGQRRLGQARLNWTAATDNIGVARYNVHRGASAGFTPSAANRIAQPTGTAYTDTGRAAGTHFYRVTAEDAAGNVGPASDEAQARGHRGHRRAQRELSAPRRQRQVGGSLDVTATASDNVGVAGVQFRVDGAALGAEDGAPWSASWATSSVANGTHTLTAVARDAAGNATTSGPVGVTVDNPAVDPTGLVAAYGLRGGHRHHRHRLVRAAANTGAISGAARSTTGRFGRA